MSKKCVLNVEDYRRLARRTLPRVVFDYLEGGSSLENFLEDFPSIDRTKAVAVLEAARESLSVDAPAA